MKHPEINSYTIISNKAPIVAGCRVEPVEITTEVKNKKLRNKGFEELTQHGFKVTPIKTSIGHQDQTWSKDGSKERRKKAREKAVLKHNGHPHHSEKKYDQKKTQKKINL